MKTYFALTFLLLVCGAFAANYAPVNVEATSKAQSQLIQDLRQLGAQYTLEKAIFVKTPSVPNGYWNIIKTESTEAKTVNGVTYYKFVVQIRCENEPHLIRARYVVSFNPSNGDTIVQSYCYQILDTDPEGPVIADAPNFVDMRLIESNSKIESLLNIGIDYFVEHAIEEGQIEDSTYEFVRIFSLQDVGYSIAPGNTFLIQVASAEGQNYRVRITVFDNEFSTYPEPIEPSYTLFPNA